MRPGQLRLRMLPLQKRNLVAQNEDLGVPRSRASRGQHQSAQHPAEDQIQQAVAVQSCPAAVEGLAGHVDRLLVAGVVPGVGHGRDGFGESVGGEGPGRPGVELFEDVASRT